MKKTIVETFIQLRDDLRDWVTNNLVELSSKKSDKDHDHILHLNLVYTVAEANAMLTASNDGKYILYAGASSSGYVSGHIYKVTGANTKEDKGLLNAKDAETLGGNPPDHYATTDVASATSNGLMSKEDKAKLDTINMTWQSY